MAFCLKTLLTIAFVAAVVHIYCANGAPPPPTASDRLDASLLSDTDRLLSLEEFGKFIAMFDQQVKNVLSAQAATKITNKNVTEAHKKFQKTYKEFNKGKAKISKKELDNLLKQIDEMAATLVAQAEAAAGTVRLEVPYCFKVELDDGSKTTYFEEYFKKKLLETKDSFAKEKGNESMQKCLKEVNQERFEKVYEKFLKIAIYNYMTNRTPNTEEFFKNYESTEAANELAEMCKEKVDKNKLAKDVAFDGTKAHCAVYHGMLCGTCCLCLPLCPLVYTAGTVTLCVERCQIAKLDKKHKAQLNELYAVLKTHTWKKKEKEETVGWRRRRIGN